VEVCATKMSELRDRKDALVDSGGRASVRPESFIIGRNSYQASGWICSVGGWCRSAARAVLLPLTARGYEWFELPSTGRIRAMEGLRGLAVLLVFLVHYDALFSFLAPRGSATYRISQVAGAMGNAGVDLFFVISGYLIYKILLTRNTALSSFWARRVERIYPTFLLAIILYVAGDVALPEAGKFDWRASGTIRYVVENLLLLPGICPIKPIVSVAWSLSYEFLFYLVLPLAMVSLALRKWKRSSRICFFVGLIMLHTLLSALGVMGHIRFSMFFVGIALYECDESGVFADRLGSLGETFTLIAFCCALPVTAWLTLNAPKVTGADPFASGMSLFRFGALATTIMAVLSYAFYFDGLLRRFFCLTPLRWLGNMSYSYYLIHGGALHALRLLLRQPHAANAASALWCWLLLPVSLVVTVVISVPVFLLVEKRFSLRAPVAQNIRADRTAILANMRK